MGRVSFVTCGLLATMTLSSASAQTGSELPVHLQAIQIEKAWKITRGKPEIVTAILSSGVNLASPEFVGSIALNAGEKGNKREFDGLDNEGNGYIDDLYGADMLDKRRAPWDFRYGSGTYLASLIVGGNATISAAAAYPSPQVLGTAPLSILGVASGSRFLPIKVQGSSGAAQLSALKDGLEYALLRRAKIVLLEVVWSGRDDFGICEVIARANLQGTLVVAPAGNTGMAVTQTMFPAACGTENLVVAAGLEDSGKLANFSSFGPQVHVAAPGRAVVGVDGEGKATTRTGTFVAGALVAGVASLVWSVHPNYTPAQVKQALVLGADDNPDLYGKVQSRGILNAHKAITVQTTVPNVNNPQVYGHQFDALGVEGR